MFYKISDYLFIKLFAVLMLIPSCGVSTALAAEGEVSGSGTTVTVGLVGDLSGVNTSSNDTIQQTGLDSTRKWGLGASIMVDSPAGPVSVAMGAIYVRRVFEIGNNTLRIERTVPTLFVPLEARLWLGNVLYVGAGGFGSIRVGSQQDSVLSGNNTLASFSSDQRETLEYGMTAAAGFGFPVNERTGLALEARYFSGLTNASKDGVYDEKIRDFALTAGLRVGI